MVNYESDAALQEIHDEMYREEEQQAKKGYKALDDRSRFWIGLFIGGVLFMIYLDKISFNQGLMIGGIAFVMLYLMRGEQKTRRELTWLECQIRIYDLLYFLQQHPIGPYQQIPKGEIRITPIGRKQWYEGQAFKRSFGVNIYDEERDIEESYFVEIDVFTGDLITFRHAPQGVTGEETKDIKLLPTPDLLISKKRDEYYGRSLAGK